MRDSRVVAAVLLSIAVGSSACAGHRVKPETIVALERQALDRWGRGDPQGFLDTYAPDVTYFDPMRERRVDGLEAMKALPPSPFPPGLRCTTSVFQPIRPNPVSNCASGRTRSDNA